MMSEASSSDVTPDSAVEKPAARYRLAWLVLVVVWNVAFIMPAIGPVMHESDQASLLEGSLRIVNGESIFGQYYNYDKQYLSYWLLALLYQLVDRSNPETVVLVGNLLAVAAVNAGFLLFGCLARSWAGLLSMAALLFAPVFFIHAPYFATNFLAFAFLGFQAWSLSHARIRWLSAFFAFAAVGCRADAVLVQPILLWAFCPEPRLSRLLRFRTLWACVAGVVGALILGKVLTEGGHDPFSPSLNFKILVAYTMLGLGSGFFILCGMGLLLGWQCWRSANWDARLFHLLGFLALWMPFIYYALHLYSTRYWTVPLAGLFALCASAHWGSRDGSREKLRRFNMAFAAGCLVLNLIPVGVGLRLPALKQPELTMTAPTLVPSADGLLPIGAYAAHVWGTREGRRAVHDHNHHTWLAALDAAGQFSEHAPPRIVNTPLSTIIQLAYYLKVGEYQLIPEIPERVEESLIIGERFLRKRPMEVRGGTKLDHEPSEAAYGVEPAGDRFGSEAVVRLTSGHNAQRDRLEALRELFRGNDFDYRQITSEELKDQELTWRAGHQVGILADAPFRLALRAGVSSTIEAKSLRGDWYAVKFLAEEGARVEVKGLANDTQILVGQSVLPAYMDIRQY